MRRITAALIVGLLATAAALVSMPAAWAAGDTQLIRSYTTQCGTEPGFMQTISAVTKPGSPPGSGNYKATILTPRGETITIDKTYKTGEYEMFLVPLNAGEGTYVLNDWTDGLQGWNNYTVTLPEWCDPQFVDVAWNYQFFDAINWMAKSGVSTGYPVAGGREYRPYDYVTRDAMAAFIYRDKNIQGYTPPATSPFIDVAPTAPFYKEIAWMYEKGYSTGWVTPAGREYRPYERITRDAMAAFLYRSSLFDTGTPPPTSPFNDVPTDHPFYKEIAWMYTWGVSTGWETANGREYRPYLNITRDAMAAFLYRNMLNGGSG